MWYSSSRWAAFMSCTRCSSLIPFGVMNTACSQQAGAGVPLVLPWCVVMSAAGVRKPGSPKSSGGCDSNVRGFFTVHVLGVLGLLLFYCCFTTSDIHVLGLLLYIQPLISALHLWASPSRLMRCQARCVLPLMCCRFSIFVFVCLQDDAQIVHDQVMDLHFPCLSLSACRMTHRSYTIC